MQRERFVSSHPWQPDRIRALAIYCSDGRWGEAFDEFCHQHLGIPLYDRFAAPGGPLWLTIRHVNLLTPYCAAREQLKFLVEAHELQRIVLITHYGCAAYAEALRAGPDETLPHQEHDLCAASQTLRGWFPSIQVETYVAMRDADRIWFQPGPQ